MCSRVTERGAAGAAEADRPQYWPVQFAAHWQREGARHVDACGAVAAWVLETFVDINSAERAGKAATFTEWSECPLLTGASIETGARAAVESVLAAVAGQSSRAVAAV